MKALFIALLFFPAFVRAAVINLAPGSTLNWSNVQPGDTIQLSSGNYTSFKVGKSGTASAPITLKGPPSGQAVFSGGLANTGYSNIVFDGGQDSGDLVSNTRKYGIKTTVGMKGGQAIGGTSSGPVTNWTIKNIDCLGPYATESNPIQDPNSAGAQGIDICHDNYPMNNLLVTDCRVLGFGTCFRQAAWNNAVVEKSYLGDTNNDGQQHEDIIYSYPGTNVTFRNNVIRNSPNDGCFFEYGGAVNFQFYNNIFYASSGWFICTKAGSKSYGPVKIWNNVFSGPSKPPAGLATVSSNGTTWASGSDVSNNIFIYVSRDTQGGTATKNAYNYTSFGGYPAPTDGITFNDSGVFVDPGHGNFRLTAAGVSTLGGKGKAISGGPPELSVDFDGVSRGTSWTPGPFQGSGSPGPTPTPPAPTPSPTATPPAPTPAPTATPAPTPTPAAKFKAGDTITPADVVNVRSTPAGTVVGTHKPGDSGEVVSGPTDAPLNGTPVSWYKITWTIAPPSGWSGDDDLTLAAAPTPTPPQPTPTPSPSATPTPPQPTPTPTPPPANPTYEQWIDDLNTWIRANPPYQDPRKAPPAD